VNYDFGVESRFDDVRVEEVHLMAEFCQPADRFTNVIIDVAQPAETFEAKIEYSKMSVIDDYQS